MSKDRLIPDLHQELARQTNNFRGDPLTPVQRDSIAHAVAASMSGQTSNALMVHAPGDDTLYTIHWVRDSVLGVLNVMNIETGYSKQLTFNGWVRPLSEVARVDLRVAVETNRTFVGEYRVLLDATFNFRDGEMPVRVDGTSGNHWANDAATFLIRTVLSRLGADVT